MACNDQESGEWNLAQISVTRGEYKFDECTLFCKQKSIQHELTTLFRLEWNGIAEHMKETIQKRIVGLMKHYGLSYGSTHYTAHNQYVAEYTSQLHDPMRGV